MLQSASSWTHYFSGLFSFVAQVNPLHCFGTMREALEFLPLDYLLSGLELHLIFVSYSRKFWIKIAKEKKRGSFVHH